MLNQLSLPGIPFSSPLLDKDIFLEHFLQNKANLQEINTCLLEKNGTNSLKYPLATALFDTTLKTMEGEVSKGEATVL